MIDRWAALVKATSDDPPDSILRPPASEAAIAALEARLGTTLPPSYRAFLAISDGAAAFPGWGLVAADPGSDRIRRNWPARRGNRRLDPQRRPPDGLHLVRDH